MNNGTEHQIWIFIIFLVVGIVSSIVFDVFRAFNLKDKRKKIILVIIADIIFWFFLSIFIFAVSLKFNDGKLRAYMFVGFCIGTFIYFNTLSAYVVRILSVMYCVVCKFLLLILFPVVFLIKLFNNTFFVVISFSRKGIKRVISKLKFKFITLKKFKR